MMRYFAILKDSFREALDSKVLYVLFFLSSVTILLVGTISFKSLSAQKTFGQFFFNEKGLPMMFLALNSHNQERMSKNQLEKSLQDLSQYKLLNVELLRGEADSPNSDYALTVVHNKWRSTPQVDASDLERERDDLRRIFKDAETLDIVQIGDVESLPGEKKESPRYRVVVHSTSRTYRVWATEPSLLFGAVPIEIFAAPLGYQAYILTKFVLGIGAWVGVLMSVVITSFFIPNMLRKGTIDMLLVKPVRRPALLLYKYVGGLSFMFLVTTYAIGGMWFMLGVKTGLWANSALLMIFTLTFFFAILYAISTFVGVVTRSTIAAILLTFGAWFLFFVVGVAHELLQQRQIEDKAAQKQEVVESKSWMQKASTQSVAIARGIMPRTTDLDYLDDLLVYSAFMTGCALDIERFDNGKHNWLESFLVSSAWIGFFLVLSCVWLTFKDY